MISWNGYHKSQSHSVASSGTAYFEIAVFPMSLFLAGLPVIFVFAKQIGNTHFHFRCQLGHVEVLVMW